MDNDDASEIPLGCMHQSGEVTPPPTPLFRERNPCRWRKASSNFTAEREALSMRRRQEKLGFIIDWTALQVEEEIKKRKMRRRTVTQDPAFSHSKLLISFRST